MLAWVYPEKEYREIGAERYAVEWWTIRPGAPEEFDPHEDVISHYEVFKTRTPALRFARSVVNDGKSAFGSAEVKHQVVDWYVEEDRIAEWQDVGDPVIVDRSIYSASTQMLRRR